MEHVSRRGFIGAGVALAATGVQAGIITSDIEAEKLKASKTTPLGLYLSPSAAYDAMKQDPEILFVDVRDPIEIMFVGHPAGLDKIIPLNVATHQVDHQSGQYQFARNPHVVEEFEALLRSRKKSKSAPLFVTCRSGSRSAAAARTLVEAGFTNVWNLTEGFEGDKDARGVRQVNGWRNRGLPWSYHLEPGVAWSA